MRRSVEEWVDGLRRQKLWGNDDSLFPATLLGLWELRQFEVTAPARRTWSTASPIRAIFRQAFEGAGLPYSKPHSSRYTLVQLGQTLCRDAEQFRARSQHLGLEEVPTSFTSFGNVATGGQGQNMQALAPTHVLSHSARRGGTGSAGGAEVGQAAVRGCL